MKVFVTGATGFVGSVVVEELIRHGHQVIGLARSEKSAVALRARGAEVQIGSLEDLDSLHSGAVHADGVINCAFNNDLSQFAHSSQIEQRAINVLGRALEGSSRPLVVTSGVALLAAGRIGTETDRRPKDSPIPRDSETPTLSFADRGVRAMVVRLSPVTHGNGEGGFAGLLIHLARQKGVSAYRDEGMNRWSAVHHVDAARLYRLALVKGEAGSIYHAVAEEGVVTKEIALAIGQALGLPTTSLTGEMAAAHFEWFNDFAKMNTLASSELTRKSLSWTPNKIGLLADIKAHLKA